jgi:hypothetical protein
VINSTVFNCDLCKYVVILSGGAEAGGTLRPLCSFTVPSFEDRSYRITSLTFSPEGEEILVSYSSDHLYLFSVKVIHVSRAVKCRVLSCI